MFFKFITLALLPSIILAVPVAPTISPHNKNSLLPRATGDTAAAQLLFTAPTSSTCTGADFPSECATNDQAAPYLISAMIKYKITSPAEMAALLALIAFESGDFKYNTNHFPGRPGQGTRAMLMPNFVLSYAQSIPELSSSLAAILLTDLNAIRALVLLDEYTWASAVWFLTTQCVNIRLALQAGDQAGFEAYMGCVGTEATSARLEYWKRAIAAFGL